jgi:hypothetical protein
MHRVPNPPKSPVLAGQELRSGGRIRQRSVGAILFLILSLAATTTSVRADESTTGGNVQVFGCDAERATTIRDHAEAMRTEAFELLLGLSEPQPWTVRCEIHVHESAECFVAAVGADPDAARGATSLEFAGDRVTTRRIDVMGDGADLIPDSLDHELVHVVLADHFVLAAPPRWADEGLAILFDAPGKQRDHEADLRDAARRGLCWSAADLLSIEDYPTDGGRQRVFYGQSAAVVRWLIARRDAATFIRFLDEVQRAGLESALSRHYGITDLASVSSAWKEVAPINTLGLADRRH